MDIIKAISYLFKVPPIWKDYLLKVRKDQQQIVQFQDTRSNNTQSMLKLSQQA